VMHNTQWVPGHFHFYLLLGVLPMVLALTFHLVDSRKHSAGSALRLALPLYIAGGLIFVGAFLAAGHVSAPRRYAAHLPQWVPYDRLGSIGALLVIVAMLLFTGYIVAGLLKSPADAAATAAAHAAD
jgi:cytochrome c oxidase subunit I